MRISEQNRILMYTCMTFASCRECMKKFFIPPPQSWSAKTDSLEDHRELWNFSCYRGRSSLDFFQLPRQQLLIVYHHLLITLYILFLSGKNVIIIFLLLHLDIYLIGLIIIIVLKAILRLQHEKHSGESNKNNHFNQK